MITIGYEVRDEGWGRKYRRITSPEMALIIRNLTGKTHVAWWMIEEFAKLNVFFHEVEHPFPSDEDASSQGIHPNKYHTHMRGSGADGATQ